MDSMKKYPTKVGAPERVGGGEGKGYPPQIFISATLWFLGV